MQDGSIPVIVAREINKEYNFKICLMTGFEPWIQ